MLDFGFHLFLRHHHIIGDITLPRASAVRSAVQFAQIAVVGSIKILLDVHEVNHITILKIMVRSVDTRQSLQQVMAVERASEVQFLQTRSIKTSEKHLVDNEHVHFLKFLEPLDVLFTFQLIAFVMQYKRSCQRPVARRQSHWFCCHSDLFLFMLPYFLRIMETLLPQAEHLSCLRVCLADNHGSDRVVVLLPAETAEVGYDIVEQRIEIAFILNDLIAVDV